MKTVTLFARTGPHAKIPVIVCSLCPRELLETCNVPQRARTQVANMTKGTLVDETPIFVRGVNSSFLTVQLSTGENVYVHENLVWKDG